MLDQTKPDPVRSPLLDAARKHGIRHGYFTRIGGVSGGIYRCLNIGTGSNDDQALVRENRRRVAEWMGVPASHLLTAHQVHSPDVVIAIGARAKHPGEFMQGDHLELSVVEVPEQGKSGRMEEYERLLGDAMDGDPTLFAGQDEVDASWAIVEPVLRLDGPLYGYVSGSAGPMEAERLVKKVGGWTPTPK